MESVKRCSIISLMDIQKDRRTFFCPTESPEEWRRLLAKPNKHWRTGYSAKALAYCWQEAGDFPQSVREVFKNSGVKVFDDVKLLLAFPEYRVPLPGGSRASQSDIFLLAKGDGQLISIMVEGKVHEPFGETIAEWRNEGGRGKERRLDYLCQVLELHKDEVNNVRYQLLHRTASAVIEARRFNAPNALMLVHSFSDSNEWFDDYSQFVASFGTKGEADSLVFAKNLDGINLYLAWVGGEAKYLKK
jgi:hypothetical protein